MGGGREPSEAPVLPEAAPIERAMLNTMVEGLDPESADEMVRELVELYLADAPGQLESVRAAIGAANPGRLRESAHGLKGASANLGAKPLAAACLELEKLGHSGSVEGAAELLAKLEREFERARAALNVVMQQGI